jgi:hypothetical protein
LFQAIAINDSLATSDLHIQMTYLGCGTILASKDETLDNADAERPLTP